MAISFHISTIPRGQSRVRHTKSGISYKSADQRADERTIESQLLPHKPKQPLTGPILMVIEAFLPVPQSKSQKWKRDALDGRIIPETKPDLDNILKNLTDCLQRMRFFSDDKQIAVLKASKRYGAPEQVGYNVSLREM